MDDYVERILGDWGMTFLKHKFAEQEIDEAAFNSLTEVEIKELIPIMGPRLRFLSNFKSLRKQNATEVEGKDTSTTITKDTPVLLGETLIGSADSNSILLPILSNESLTEAEFTNLLNSTELTVLQEVSTSRASSLTPVGSFNLAEALKSTIKGRGLLKRYEDKGVLNDAERCILTEVVVELRLGSKESLVNDDLELLAREIVRCFPTEIIEIYYVAPRRFKGKHVIANGKLVDRYRNQRRRLTDNGLIPKRAKLSSSCNSTPSTSTPSTSTSTTSSQSPTFSEDVKDSIEWLKNCTEPWSEVERNWANTSEVRLHEKESSRSVAEYLKDWPVLKLTLGYTLINFDFAHAYPGREMRLFRNWTEFTAKALLILQTRRKDDFAELLADLESDELSEGARTVAFLLLLPYLCRPCMTIRQKKLFWKPSSAESLESFVHHVKNLGEIASCVERKREKLREFNLTLQPFVFVVGPSYKSIEASFVFVDTVQYKVESPLNAVDLCFKIFFSLNAEYPAASTQVWVLIQKALYEPFDKPMLNVSRLLNDLKNAES